MAPKKISEKLAFNLIRLDNQIEIKKLTNLLTLENEYKDVNIKVPIMAEKLLALLI